MRIVRLPKVSSQGRRTFLDFPDGILDEEIQLFDGQIRSGLPGKWSIRNALVYPICHHAENHRWTGGIYDASGYRPELSLQRYQRTERISFVNPPEAVPNEVPVTIERAWFGGYLSFHYGHLLMESLSRVLCKEVVQSTDPILFLDLHKLKRPPSEALPLRDYVQRAFRRIGIDPARIVQCIVPTAVKHLMIFDPSFEVQSYIYPEVYRRIQVPRSDAGKVVYLSRSQLDINRRQNDGEPALEKFLERTVGAEIVHPQNLPLEEQIEKLASASVVIGPEGSAFHTLMFLRSAPHSIMLCNSRPHPNYLLCDDIYDGDSTYIFAAQKDAEKIRRRTGWSLDFDRVTKIVRRVCRRNMQQQSAV